MTTPAQDRDQRAALSAPREAAQPPDDSVRVADAETLREAARAALAHIEDAEHYRETHGYCNNCDGIWPCEVEMARRVLADALGLKEDR
jgi:RNA polymerase-binding transcription factor DksA